MSVNFPLLLVIAVAICGFLALLDLLVLAPRRRAAITTYQQTAPVVDPAEMARLKKEPVLVEYGKSFFPVLLVVLVLRSWLVEPFQIPSGSMRPTLEEGDFILVNKFSYGIRLPVLDTKIIPISDPKRGDVMVFRLPSDPSVNYIKRVIGVPGDTVRYSTEKRLYVNDKLIDETVVNDEALGTVKIYQEKLGDKEHQIRRQTGPNRYEADRTWKVPAGHYFMMGDNRDNSKDSRYWENPPGTPPELMGMVPDKNIVGKAFAIWMSWPNPKINTLPNFSRVGAIH